EPTPAADWRTGSRRFTNPAPEGGDKRTPFRPRTRRINSATGLRPGRGRRRQTRTVVRPRNRHREPLLPSSSGNPDTPRRTPLRQPRPCRVSLIPPTRTHAPKHTHTHTPLRIEGQINPGFSLTSRTTTRLPCVCATPSPPWADPATIYIYIYIYIY
ncbi:hypothetical protein AMELA_G00010880, partial [Ameiurus melas]